MFNANNFINCLFLNPMHEHLEVESGCACISQFLSKSSWQPYQVICKKGYNRLKYSKCIPLAI